MSEPDFRECCSKWYSVGINFQNSVFQTNFEKRCSMVKKPKVEYGKKIEKGQREQIQRRERKCMR